MTKTIYHRGEQFKIKNIGFVFGNFEGNVYRYRPRAKFFKYQRLGYICFPIKKHDSIEMGIKVHLDNILMKEKIEQETARKIQKFKKTLDK